MTPARSRTKGMTLVELTVGMVMLSVIALAVAGLTASLSDAYAGGERFYTSLQMARVSMLRIETEARKAKEFLSDDASSEAAIALWADDANHDGKVNLSEIVLYWYQSGTGNLVRQQLVFPPANQTLDYALEKDSLSDVNMVVMLMWWFSPYLQEAELCENVSSCRFVTDQAPPDTKVLSIRMTVGQTGKEVQLQTAASLER
ncbi:MAG: type II secretion system protein J [Phycisphaerae bacterium]